MILSHSRLSRTLLGAALAAAAGGCALNFDARALGVTATMAVPASQTLPADTFAVTSRAIHLLWGAVAVKMPNLRTVLGSQISGNQSVANLHISARKTLPDLIVTVLTAGVVSPTAVTYSGVIVPGGP